jgi:uncharacterized protein (DUF2384 family)
MKKKNPELPKVNRVIKRSRLGVVKSGMLQPFAVISRFQKDFGLTQPVVVRMTGYSPRSVASWSKGVKATEPARRKFTELVRLFDALADLMENPKEVAEWLQEPNSAFDGSTPLQVIERGETDRLWRMIYTLESGDPG